MTHRHISQTPSWLQTPSGWVLLGFLLQWPTLPTLLMFPILVCMYVRLAHREEREVLAEFGEVYACYAVTTPSFFPRLRRMVRREA